MDILQVGDIVRIGELTPEIQHELDTHHYECFDDTKPFIGKHAVVVNVQDEDSGVVGFLICEPEYRFTFDNLSELNRDDVIETVPSQVTLVHGSPFRTHKMANEGVTHLFRGKPLPKLFDTVQWYTKISNGEFGFAPRGGKSVLVPMEKSVLVPMEVTAIFMYEHHIVMLLYNAEIQQFEPLSIPMEAIDNTSVFTTF